MDVTAIITTIGTRPNLLRCALVSVETQNLVPCQILVVVDGTAELARRVRSMLQKNVNVACTQVETSVGVSAARNLGARLANSEHIAYLDDDDEWFPGHLEAFADASPDFGLAAFVKESADGTRVLEKRPPANLHPRAFYVTNPGVRGSNIFVRRSLALEIGGFSTDLPTFNDLDFAIRISEQAGVRYRREVNASVLFRRHHAARLTDPNTSTIALGLRVFRSRYAARMTSTDLARFDSRARRIWQIEAEEIL